MCYRKPGPRCSHHTSERLQNVDTALATYNETLTALENSPESHTTEVVAKIERTKLLRERMEATREEAQADYDTSPAGLEETAFRYKKAVESGDKTQTKLLKEKWMTDRATRDEQLNAIKADATMREDLGREGELRRVELAREWREKVAENRKHIPERVTSVESWNSSMPPDYQPIQEVKTHPHADGPNVEAVLHGDIRAEVAKEAFEKAGNSSEGITFTNATSPVPHVESMPHISSADLQAKIKSGEVSISNRREFYASSASNLGEEGKGVRVNFSPSVYKPTVVRRDGADTNAEPELVLLPSEKSRTLSYEESLTLASAIGNPETVHLRNRRGAPIGSFERGKIHGAITRGKTDVPQPGRAKDRLKEAVDNLTADKSGRYSY